MSFTVTKVDIWSVKIEDRPGGLAKVLGATVSRELERIEVASGQIERHLALAAESGARLDAELAQLRRSRARLNVLTSAIEDVRASVGRLQAVYPRK